MLVKSMNDKILEQTNSRLLPKEISGNGISGNGMSGNGYEMNEEDFSEILKELNQT